ncbi:MAG TPA: SDR family NAD(P)-dependent oxidoreductase [Candidatus Limnocylindria bacterium]|nr:SDR family NAD(P)-dependent oxidoreductase [Candidatus Limnocylindria bacterium]
MRRRALVTGGAVRVGRALALALAEAGMDVAIAYHASARQAAGTVRELKARGARAVAIRADLRQARAAHMLVARAARALGGLDVLVNNAALFYRTPLATTPPARYDAMLAVNVRAVLLCAQAAAARMPSGGHIVNIGDAAAERPEPGWVAYALSKAALATLTRGLAEELRPRGIAVNCVAPGPVLKPEGLPDARWTAIREGGGDGVAAVAAAVVGFATCAADVTGQVLTVDGEAAVRR